jgi:hypothetical protein
MESISLLLSEALTPYRVTLDPSDSPDVCHLTLTASSGAIVLERTVSLYQLHDKRLLTDVVDGLHRDLLIAEGRLQPCVIAALHNAAQSRAFTLSAA